VQFFHDGYFQVPQAGCRSVRQAIQSLLNSRKPGCRCQHPRQPQRHGPYYHLDYVHHGKKTTRFIRAEQLPEVRRQLANLKKLRHWVDQWVTLSLERAEILRRESAKHTP